MFVVFDLTVFHDVGTDGGVPEGGEGVFIGWECHEEGSMISQ